MSSFYTERRLDFLPGTPSPKKKQRPPYWKSPLARSSYVDTVGVYVPRRGGKRRAGVNVLPDRSVHDDEGAVNNVSVGSGYKNYISLPGLGSGNNQRHSNLIKIWSIHITGSLQIKSISTPETIIAEMLVCWAYKPSGSFEPEYREIFDVPANVDGQHMNVGRFMKHKYLSDYKVLARRSYTLTNCTPTAAGTDKVKVEMFLKYPYRQAKYVQFKDGSTTGYYSDCQKGGLFYYINIYCKDHSAIVEGDMDSRIVYYH